MNIPKPKSSFLTMRVTSDDKQKEGMIYVIEFQDKTELKIVNDILFKIIGARSRM
jgi:hypothetical protein